MAALEEKGISTHLRRVISSYLENRRFEENETKYRVTARAPQGSVLGPTLWNLAYDGVYKWRIYRMG